MLWPFALLLVLSGIASLTYQVTWVRLLGLSVGATSAAISSVVAAFFLGLSLGSFLAGRLRWVRRHAFFSYLTLELVTGASGLALLPALLNLDRLVALFPGLGSSLLFKFLLTVLLLLLPTLCMGATFPVMARVMVRRGSELGSKVSALYGLNTFGAVLGALLSGFVFIPSFGLDGTIFVACGLNVSVAVVGFVLRTRLAPEPEADAAEPSQASAERVTITPRAYRALIVLATTGFVAIASEVAWTRYLVMFVGTTIYGFSAIVSAVLMGVALGSWSVKRWIDRWRAPERWLVIGLCLLGLCLLLARSGLSQVPRIQGWLAQETLSPNAVHLVRYVVAFIVVLPANWVFGALFPVSLRVFCADRGELTQHVGLAYAVNTLMGIVGSLVAGFYWLPTFGTSHLLFWTALSILMLPFVFWEELRGRWSLIVPISLLLALPVGLVLPTPDYRSLLASVRLDLPLAKQAQRTSFLREGRTGVISVETGDDRFFKIYNNGLNESKIDRTDPHNALLMESLLGLIPYFLHEHPRSAFVVGLGGGATMRALEYTKIQSLRVVELEPVMSQAVASVLKPGPSGLVDPRLTLSFNDARNTLLVEPKRYDIIVSQPSHPWRAGSANVFTREFFQIARERLAPGGIYGQWLALFRMDQTTLRSILRAFVDVFPEALAMANLQTGDLLFFGSNQPMKFSSRMVARSREEDVRRLLGRRGVRNPVSLLRLFALSRREMVRAAGGAEPSTDTNLLPEVRLARLLGNPKGAESPAALLRGFGHFDILPYLDPSVQSKWLIQLALDLKSHGNKRRALAAVRQLNKVDAKTAAKLGRMIRRR